MFLISQILNQAKTNDITLLTSEMFLISQILNQAKTVKFSMV